MVAVLSWSKEQACLPSPDACMLLPAEHVRKTTQRDSAALRRIASPRELFIACSMQQLSGSGGCWCDAQGCYKINYEL